MDWYRTSAVMFPLALCAAIAVAQDSPQLDPLPTGFAPVAIAIRPGGDTERHELFVADETGRIVRISSDAVDQPHEVVGGSGSAPAAIAFLNSRTCLVVSADVPPVLRAYEISENGGAVPAGETKFEVRSASDDRFSATGTTLGPTSLFVIGTGGNEAGLLLRSRVRSGVPGDLKPFLNTTEKGGGSRPTCIGISTRGWVVVGDAGQRGADEDSRLTFYHPSDSAAEPVLIINPGLHDISSIAYSPQGGLYAADVAEADPEHGGIYRIEMDYREGNINGKAVRIASVDRPKAIAFGHGGTMYVIAREVDNQSNRLFKITGVEQGVSIRTSGTAP